MEKQLFSEKSIKTISSPEQLNDYVRVTTPGVWVVLAAIIVLLLGAGVWGIFGHLEATVSACAVADNGLVSCYISEGDSANVKVGQRTVISGKQLELTSVSKLPMEITADAFDDYTLHVGGLSLGDWVYVATAKCDLPDGVYEVDIVVDSIPPISFLLN